jgi:hypothetical protein
MRRAHSILVLVCFLGAFAIAGCGISTYTSIEAEGATDGMTGFVFQDGPDLRGVVTAQLDASRPAYDVAVSFTAKGPHMPAIRDVRVGMSGTRWGRAVSVTPDGLAVRAVSCSQLAICTPIDAQPVPAGPPGRARPGDLDDFMLTISYLEEDGGHQIPVTRQVRAHPVHKVTHHYPWFLRDC